MTREETTAASVRAVVVYDGRVLLTDRQGGWGLPAGAPQPAETPEAAAARVVYELTGYLVDGSQTLSPRQDSVPAVVCQLLTEAPSGSGSLAPERIRWTEVAEAAEAADAVLPTAVRAYLLGHRPV
ncbi:NUDIX domain-containing protein [Streptomyces sp. NPDC093094]|uniref:NUDIX domain-containing protein n=1 Tax=Streptomyces sp. NPDC093094 TaxID=3366026 RepID=UPI0037F967DA